MGERSDRWRLLVVGALIVSVGLSTNSLAAKRPGKPPMALGSFEDNLGANGWLADHVSFYVGRLDLRPNDVSSLGEPSRGTVPWRSFTNVRYAWYMS